MKLSQKETIEGYLFLLPWMVGFAVWIAGPMITSLILSFCKYEVVTPAKFVGFGNYQKLIHNRLFWQSLKITAYYTFGAIPLQLCFGLAFALLLNQKIKALSVFRTIYYMPAVISGVAAAILWVWVFNPDFGIINIILMRFGIKGPGWLTSTTWVIPSFIIMSVWKSGRYMLLYLGGLQNIPTPLYEAAEVDGANTWEKFWKVTLPMLTPVIFFNSVMGIIESFQIFTAAFVMTAGGPANASLFYVLNLYNNAFRYFKMGYASALAWVLFFIILMWVTLIFKSSPLWLYYEGELKRTKK